jgi:hypothetical protein
MAHYVFPSIVNMGDNASKAVSADYDSTRDYASELLPPDAVMGAPLGRFLWGPGKRWPIKLIPEEYRKPQHSDVQTLILSGSVDFSTPAENATKDLLPYFKNSRQIILAEMGHVGDLWKLQPRTTHRMLTSFFETGLADGSLYKYEPMRFEVRWGYPLLAKLAVAGCVLLVILLGGLVWLMVQFIRRRKAKKRLSAQGSA